MYGTKGVYNGLPNVTLRISFVMVVIQLLYCLLSIYYAQNHEYVVPGGDINYAGYLLLKHEHLYSN